MQKTVCSRLMCFFYFCVGYVENPCYDTWHFTRDKQQYTGNALRLVLPQLQRRRMENLESSSSSWDRWRPKLSSWPPYVSTGQAPAAASGQPTPTMKSNIQNMQNLSLVGCPPLNLPLLPSVSDAAALDPLAELETTGPNARHINIWCWQLKDQSQCFKGL